MPRRSLVAHDRRKVAAGDLRALVGVDEAGRGALFGPVSAGAVLLPADFYSLSWCRRRARAVDDSKRLTAEQRERLAGEILELEREGRLHAAVAFASVVEIEERNILGATQLAMGRALQAVFAAAGVDQDTGGLFAVVDSPAQDGLPIDACAVLIDGKPLPGIGVRHEAVVGGDGRSLAIAMASILAKVERDREILRLDAEFPGYYLGEHKGYATPAHREAILRLGPTVQHRDRFLRNLLDSAGSAETPDQLGLGL